MATTAELQYVLRVQDRELKTLQRDIRATNRALGRDIPRSTTTAQRSFTGLNRGMSRTTKTVLGLGSVLSRNLVRGTALVTVGMGFALKSAGDFDKQLSVFQATAHATGDEMARVSALATQLGADVKLPATSAKDAADAMTELAKAGLTVKDSMGAARGVLQLATAGELEVADAAKIAAGALNAFGLEGTEATRVADLLAGAANASSADVSDLALALQQSSASAHQLGVPVEDLTTLIAEMANQGIRGSDAGTSLKTMFQRLNPQTDKARTAMEKLGVDVFNSHGRFIGIRGAIDQYQKALKDLTPEQRQQAIQTIFGSDAQRAANVVLFGGVDAFDKLRKKVTEAGAAQKLAEARTKGFNGAMQALKSAGETLAITIGQRLIPVVVPLLHHLTDMTIRLNNFTASFSPEQVAAYASTLRTKLAIAFSDVRAQLQEFMTTHDITWGTAKEAVVDFASTAIPLVADFMSGIIDGFNAAGPIVLAFTGGLLGLANIVREVAGLFGDVHTAGEALVITFVALKSATIAYGIALRALALQETITGITRIGTAASTTAPVVGGLVPLLGGLSTNTGKFATAAGGAATTGGRLAPILGGLATSVGLTPWTAAAVGAVGLGVGLGILLTQASNSKTALDNLSTAVANFKVATENVTLTHESFTDALRAEEGAELNVKSAQRARLDVVKNAISLAKEQAKAEGETLTPKDIAKITKATKHTLAYRQAVQNLKNAHDTERDAAKFVHDNYVSLTKAQRNAAAAGQKTRSTVRDVVKEWNNERAALQRNFIQNKDVIGVEEARNELQRDAAELAGTNATKLFEQADAIEAVKPKMAAQIRQLASLILQGKGGSEAAQELTDKILGIPKETKPQIKTNAKDEKKDVDNLDAAMRGLKDKDINVNVNASLNVAGVTFLPSGQIAHHLAELGKGGIIKPTDFAVGGLVKAVPGGVYRMAEAGFDEAVITTDPKHKNRTYEIISEVIRRIEGRHNILPGLAAGGLISAGKRRIAELSGKVASQVGGAFVPPVRAFREAERMDGLNRPYLWGGGHAGFSASGPWDCSGAVSQVLHASGYPISSPMVSGALAGYGRAGHSGLVEVLANDGHAYMQIFGKSYGTSNENPGGGWGGPLSYGERSGFAVRVPSFARGGIIRRNPAPGATATGQYDVEPPGWREKFGEIWAATKDYLTIPQPALRYDANFGGAYVSSAYPNTVTFGGVLANWLAGNSTDFNRSQAAQGAIHEMTHLLQPTTLSDQERTLAPIVEGGASAVSFLLAPYLSRAGIGVLPPDQRGTKHPYTTWALDLLKQGIPSLSAVGKMRYLDPPNDFRQAIQETIDFFQVPVELSSFDYDPVQNDTSTDGGGGGVSRRDAKKRFPRYLNQIWKKYHRFWPGRAQPGINWKGTSIPGRGPEASAAAGVWDPHGNGLLPVAKRFMYFPVPWAQQFLELLDGDTPDSRASLSYYAQVIPHEWAHIFQDANILRGSTKEREGGATAFTVRERNRLRSVIGFSPSAAQAQGGAYAGYRKWVEDHHDKKWILHDQFGGKGSKKDKDKDQKHKGKHDKRDKRDNKDRNDRDKARLSYKEFLKRADPLPKKPMGEDKFKKFRPHIKDLERKMRKPGLDRVMDAFGARLDELKEKGIKPREEVLAKQLRAVLRRTEEVIGGGPVVREHAITDALKALRKHLHGDSLKHLEKEYVQGTGTAKGKHHVNAESAMKKILRGTNRVRIDAFARLLGKSVSTGGHLDLGKNDLRAFGNTGGLLEKHFKKFLKRGAKGKDRREEALHILGILFSRITGSGKAEKRDEEKLGDDEAIKRLRKTFKELMGYTNGGNIPDLFNRFIDGVGNRSSWKRNFNNASGKVNGDRRALGIAGALGNISGKNGPDLNKELEREFKRGREQWKANFIPLRQLQHNTPEARKALAFVIGQFSGRVGGATGPLGRLLMPGENEHIPKAFLAKGGIVRHRPGGVTIVAGEGGRDEAVIPLPNGGLKGGGGTTIINVNINGPVYGANSTQLARELTPKIKAEIYRDQTRNVNSGFVPKSTRR